MRANMRNISRRATSRSSHENAGGTVAAKGLAMPKHQTIPSSDLALVTGGIATAETNSSPLIDRLPKATAQEKSGGLLPRWPFFPTAQ
jgi:hypothetical protein